MPKVVENEEGKEETLFTAEDIEAAKKAEADRLQADFDAKMLEKDEHQKKKLAEFETGKTAQELKDIERDKEVAEAKRIAEEAVGKVTESEGKRQNTIKEAARIRFTGGDAELDKKFEESWALINVEIKEDADIYKRAELAANLAGLNGGGTNEGGMQMSGGYAPSFVKKDETLKEADHQTFNSELGLDKFLEETAGPKAPDQK